MNFEQAQVLHSIVLDLYNLLMDYLYADIKNEWHARTPMSLCFI